MSYHIISYHIITTLSDTARTYSVYRGPRGGVAA